MRNLIFAILLSGCFISSLMAQDQPPARYNEFGIIFSSLNSFGLRYKYGGDKTSFRLSLLTLNLGVSNSSDNPTSGQTQKQSSYGAGLRLGFDHKVRLFSSFSLLLGAEAGIGYTYQHTTNTASGISTDERVDQYLTPTLSFIFGLNYILKDHLVFGAEINPTLMYAYQSTDYKQPSEYTSKSKTLEFSLFTSGAGLYIAYRFGK